MEIEIGRGKTARRAYGFDDIAIVPSRRTRDPRDVDITWEFSFSGKDYAFPLPVLASAMDGVVDPAFAIDDGQARRPGGAEPRGHPDALRRSRRRSSTPSPPSTRKRRPRKMQEIYAAEDVKPELITQRVKEIKDGGVLAAASLTPQNVERYIGAAHGRRARHPHHPGHGRLGRARLELRQAARPERVHRATSTSPCIVGGCCSYQGALHLMRTGAVGVLVGVGPGHACTSRRVLGIGVPQCTADRGRRGGAHAPPRRDRPLLPRHRRRRHAHRRRPRQGDRRAAPTPS